MNKVIVCLTIFIVSINLFGCDSKERVGNQSKKVEQVTYKGPTLTIGYVGKTDKLPKISNIVYKKLDLSTLSKEQDSVDIDGLIIPENSFDEADKEQYVPFFNREQYPVFFYGLSNSNTTPFLFNKVSLKEENHPNSAFVQGYRMREDGGKDTWDLYLKNDNTEKESETLVRIFEIINGSKK